MRGIAEVDRLDGPDASHKGEQVLALERALLLLGFGAKLLPHSLDQVGGKRGEFGMRGGEALAECLRREPHKRLRSFEGWSGG